jgi:hypothetical protein
MILYFFYENIKLLISRRHNPFKKFTILGQNSLSQNKNKTLILIFLKKIKVLTLHGQIPFKNFTTFGSTFW